MKTPFNTENITTLISKATEITGDIYFSGTLEVEGKVNGNIIAEDDSAAEVRVRENGSVVGGISVPSIIVNGLVEGDVHSCRHIELAAKAKVVGNVYYNLIEMVMGSEVNGSLRHRAEGSSEPKRLSVHATEIISNSGSVILD